MQCCLLTLRFFIWPSHFNPEGQTDPHFLYHWETLYTTVKRRVSHLSLCMYVCLCKFSISGLKTCDIWLKITWYMLLLAKQNSTCFAQVKGKRCVSCKIIISHFPNAKKHLIDTSWCNIWFPLTLIEKRTHKESTEQNRCQSERADRKEKTSLSEFPKDRSTIHNCRKSL